MRALKGLALWMAVCAALGCRKTPAEFVPLENGRKAVYDVEYVTGLGNVQRAQAIQRIDGTRKIGGAEYFRVITVFTGVPGWEPEVVYQRFAGNGVREVRYVSGKPAEYLYLPVPPAVGKTWTIDAAGIDAVCRVESHEPALLPEKTYEDAWKVACSGSRGGVYFKSYAYMVQGLGAVRLVQEAGGIRMEMRLREVGRA